MKKKLLSVVLVSMMAIGLLAGCGSNGSSNSNQASAGDNKAVSSDAESSVNEFETDTADISGDAAAADNTAADTTDGTGKVLVVYYSATGSTKGVAEAIAKSTGGDLFEIQPKEPYTDDDLNWTNDNSRVSREHENENEREVELVSTSVDNWDSYDTVFIGYPIWWGIAAWPVDNFVKDNDFTGKTVIPFCTSASSGIGDSGNLLEEMTGTGNWQTGERFRSSASDSDVETWVESLGLAK